jgi:hypothetical protein
MSKSNKDRKDYQPKIKNNKGKLKPIKKPKYKESYD